MHSLCERVVVLPWPCTCWPSLAYKEGDRATSARLAGSVNTNPRHHPAAPPVVAAGPAGGNPQGGRVWLPFKAVLRAASIWLKYIGPWKMLSLLPVPPEKPTRPARWAIASGKTLKQVFLHRRRMPWNGNLEENHAGRGDRHDQGRVSVRRQKNRVDRSSFFCL